MKRPSGNRIIKSLREALEYARTGGGDVTITVYPNAGQVPGRLRFIQVIEGGKTDDANPKR